MKAGALLIFFLLIYVVVYIGLLAAIYECAKNRGRNAGWWTFLSFFITPLFFLAFINTLGETKEKREERIVEEELLKLRVREEYNSESSNTD